MNYGKLTAGTTKTAIDTAKLSEKGEIITYLSRMGDVLEQIFERNAITETFFGILIFCNSDITDILLWEHKFQIVVHHNVFTTKTGKVFCDDAVDPSRIHIVNHSLKCWSVKIRTRPSIVNILVHRMELVVTGKLL